MTEESPINAQQPPSTWVDEEITEIDRRWACLSWICWPIAIIALLSEDKKRRPFIRHHAVQAIVFSIVGYAISGALSIVIVGCFIGFALLVYTLYLAIEAYEGEHITVPFVTDFCQKQGWI